MSESLDLYWRQIRVGMGFNPDEPMTIREKIIWKEVNEIRKACKEESDPVEAIVKAAPFDKQHFLENRWNELNLEEKENMLSHVWFNKGRVGVLFGYEYWLPFFKEVGFMTNCNATRPKEPTKLYRGTEAPFKRGISWTTDLEVAKSYVVEGSPFGEVKIYQTIVEPESIFGIFFEEIGVGRTSMETFHSIEYIVNYQDLKEIKLLEE